MDLLQYTFFQHALLGSLLASIACGIIGTYIVTRRLVFISGGITHASFGGIGLGLFAGISPILSAAVFSVLSAFGVEWLSRRKDMREDSAIAVFWTLGMALQGCSCQNGDAAGRDVAMDTLSIARTVVTETLPDADRTDVVMV